MAALIAVAVMAAPVTSARAAESTWPTAQATAANAEWVPYLDPPPKPAAICLVDSGVNVTPDTPADSPDGPIVKRLSLDGGTGEAAGTTWEALHGTRMAMVAGAPMNDWGTVGMWPGVRIVSVRAMPMGETTAPFDSYTQATERCRKWATPYNIVAINLSLACTCSPSEYEGARLQSQVAAAHDQGLSVVGAVGNDGAAVSWPARAAGVLGIAASNSVGALCSFSNRGTGVDASALGCGMDLADPATGQAWSGYNGGTSAAAASASVALALLRSYRPDLSWTGAEASLATDARQTLDFERLFRGAGLGHLVDAARAHMPEPLGPIPDPRSDLPPGTDFARTTPTSPSPLPSVDQVSGGRLSAPRVGRVRRLGTHVTISIRNRPRGAAVLVVVERRRSEFAYSILSRRSARASTLTLTLPHTQGSLRIGLRFWLTDTPGGRSAPTYRSISL